MNRAKRLTAVLAIVYLLFLAWYDGWGQGTLSKAEVEAYLANFDQFAANGNAAADPAGIRRELEQFGLDDDGKEFIMLNLNTYQPSVGGGDARYNQDYAAYGRASLPLILSRAGHPIFFAQGIQSLFNPRYEEEPWQQVILVRYRSRRDFIAMVTSDAYLEIAGLRSAGIKFDEVFPTHAMFSVASPRLFIALLLAVIGLTIHFIWRGSRKS
ncbi:MAG: hypothetical protein E2O58_13565 [Gammaproteobacteria bacterium]|nr:MAG: hypothetical protein E2O58_13565 [Gammaproteobacteria bacterium]